MAETDFATNTSSGPSLEAIKAEADRYAGASPDEPPRSPSAKDSQAPAPQSPAARGADPLAALVARLDEIRPHIQDENPRLAATIERLAAHSDHADYVSRLHYPAHVGQALQDTERLAGPIETDPTLRQELSRLATSAPGLRNDRLQKLLELTPALQDQDLVNQIREKASEVSRLPDQNSEAIRSAVNDLAFDAAVAQRRAPGPSAGVPDLRQASQKATGGQPQEPQATEPAVQEDYRAREQRELAALGPDPRETAASSPGASAGRDAKASSAANGAARQPGPEPATSAPNAPNDTASPPRDERQQQDVSEETKKDAADDPKKTGSVSFTGPAGAAASFIAGLANATKAPDKQTSALRRQPGNDRASAPAQDEANPEESSSDAKPKQAQDKEESKKLDPFSPSKPGGLLSNFFQAVAPVPRQEAPPPKPAPAAQGQGQAPNKFNFGQRLGNFEERKRPEYEAQDIADAERAGQAAHDALKALENGPAEKILKRIEDASKTTPGGIEKVIEGMQEGGPFDDLRKAFKGVLAADKSLKAAFEEAEGALANYARHRNKITQALGSHQNADALSKKFEELDSKIGEAAWTIPGTKDGESMFKKLSDGAGAIFDKIAGALRGAFGASASASASARPSPGF